jgi:hypothetical protein
METAPAIARTAAPHLELIAFLLDGDFSFL